MELCLVTDATPGASPVADPLVTLVNKIAGGQEQALAELYDTTSRRVYGLTLRILRDPGAAEEATLDTYTQVWRQAERYTPQRGDVLPWLLTLARSRSLDLRRSLVRHSSREELLTPEMTVSDAAPDPEAASRLSQREERVRKALEALPREQREAIEAAYFNGLSHTEAARELAQPLGTVKTRIRSGLTSLRRALGGVEGGLAVDVRSLFVDAATNRQTILVRMQPGSSYPIHVHEGHEECYVIEGDLIDGDRRMIAGDYSCFGAGSRHGPLSTEAGCLLLVQASMDDYVVEPA